ncbi:MAG: TolC family protein [Gammaproteobacteria bacterium]|nr:TolC family protein [Gammaproteobacteria bacterium]MBA3731406.1 TolC family protein [Gammaproteobacteria bacterium]
MRIDARAMAVLLSTILTTGCASIPENAGFGGVQTTVAERTGQRVQWNQDTDADQAAENAVRRMLRQPLNVDAAAQVALLNNRRLQGVYEELSLSQAGLVQAGLLTNPVFSTAVGFPLDGGSLDLSFSIVQEFLHVLYRPLRTKIAGAQFEATRLRVAEAVIDLAADVRGQFYHMQADAQRLEFLRRVVRTTAVSAEAARRLYAAGNITDLDVAREEALYQESRLALVTAQTRLVQDRERLNALMGLWGNDTQWTIAPRLPEMHDLPFESANLEQRAIEASLALGAARKEIEAATASLGFTDATALIPILESGVDAEREEGEWEVGPSLAFPLPFFNQGQARLVAARAELRRAQQTYWAQAVEIRATVRALRYTALSACNRARHVQEVLLPLYTRIVNHTQLQYNAMQIGIFQLLQARQQQINAGLRYIDTLSEFWLARVALEQTLSGSLAEVDPVSMAEIPTGDLPAISIIE